MAPCRARGRRRHNGIIHAHHAPVEDGGTQYNEPFIIDRCGNRSQPRLHGNIPARKASALKLHHPQSKTKVISGSAVAPHLLGSDTPSPQLTSPPTCAPGCSASSHATKGTSAKKRSGFLVHVRRVAPRHLRARRVVEHSTVHTAATQRDRRENTARSATRSA